MTKNTTDTQKHVFYKRSSHAVVDDLTALL